MLPQLEQNTIYNAINFTSTINPAYPGNGNQSMTSRARPI